jgi:hypothetical protein
MLLQCAQELSQPLQGQPGTGRAPCILHISTKSLLQPWSAHWKALLLISDPLTAAQFSGGFSLLLGSPYMLPSASFSTPQFLWQRTKS